MPRFIRMTVTTTIIIIITSEADPGGVRGFNPAPKDYPAYSEI